jgi:hypothetical protein
VADEETEKFSFGDMVWGCIGEGYKSELIFLDEKIDGPAYLKFLNDHRVFEILDEKFGAFGYEFMHDGAPAHLSKLVLEDPQERVWILWGWPPNSPDLNPIEMIWAIMKRRLNEMSPPPRNEKELRAALKQIWDGLD